LHIVSLGDSLAYGTGDESGEGITGRIEDELRTRGVSSVSTTNLGANGAQTTDLIARLGREDVRRQIAKADAVVLSIGANDLFRTAQAREETLRDPLTAAQKVLDSIATIVERIHDIKPDAQVFVLGAYNPVPKHVQAATIDEYLRLWDVALARRFENDAFVAVVQMTDIVGPERLSREDHFHPGGEAYAETAKRIAEILTTA
jgi:lysophospholipase L1-like esterase